MSWYSQCIQVKTSWWMCKSLVPLPLIHTPHRFIRSCGSIFNVAILKKFSRETFSCTPIDHSSLIRCSSQTSKMKIEPPILRTICIINYVHDIQLKLNCGGCSILSIFYSKKCGLYCGHWPKMWLRLPKT